MFYGLINENIKNKDSRINKKYIKMPAINFNKTFKVGLDEM